MTIQNAGEKEQGMIEGPYKITEKVGEGWYVHGLSGSILKGCLRHEREDADRLAGLLNLAHAHATDAAARRVRELEEANKRLESSETQLITERDRAEELLDEFVAAVGGSDVCGEHSNLNCPWTVALEEVECIIRERGAFKNECAKARAILGPFGTLRDGIIQEDGLMYEDARRASDALAGKERT